VKHQRLTAVNGCESAAQDQAETAPEYLSLFIPKEIGAFQNSHTAIPNIAKDPRLVPLIEASVQRILTTHDA
jgi:hypothetical protein